MIMCKLCNEEFDNNLGGQLTNHLLSYHNITIEEYVIITEYNEISPKCECGFCLEVPRYNRGKFFKFAKGHNTFKFREEQYVIRFGEPTCEVCGNLTGFHRANPKPLCCECMEEYQYKNNMVVKRTYAFENPETQDKVKQTVFEKYGVAVVSQSPEIREKMKESLRTNPRPVHIHTEEQRRKMSVSTKRKWTDPDFRNKTSKNLKIACNKPEERARRSIVQKERWKLLKENNTQDPLYKSSKLHMSIREELNLSAYGFISEQVIDWYVADELCPDKKLIIEINGDFWHANPNKYLETDVIKAPGEPFIAGDKWKLDMEKYKKYIELGYDLIVIWESEYKEDKQLLTYKEQLRQIFGF